MIARTADGQIEVRMYFRPEDMTYIYGAFTSLVREVMHSQEDLSSDGKSAMIHLMNIMDQMIPDEHQMVKCI